MIKYDLLVYLGLLPLIAVIVFSGFVIWKTPTDTDLETRKIRMADAILVGLLALFDSLLRRSRRRGGANLQQGFSSDFCAGGHHSRLHFRHCKKTVKLARRVHRSHATSTLTRLRE